MENEKNLEEVQEEVLPSEEPVPVEETVPAEETAPAEAVAEEEATAEESAAEETAEEAKAEEKKATPGKMALLIGAIAVVAAIIVALLVGGSKKDVPAGEAAPTLDTNVEVAETPTIPADGNPNDETCKGTYTVTDEAVKAAADTVVATIGEYELTNAQLQVIYWMQVQNFLSSEYGSYMMSYGMLDYTQSLDTQTCLLAENKTWQQFFLKEALTTWRNYCSLSDKAKAAEMTLSEEEQNYLDALEENLSAAAQQYGLQNAEELLTKLVGAGAGMAEYRYFQELLGYGNLYYDVEYAKLTPTMEEMEAYFAENETALAENGITKETKLVDVRHILIMPEGATSENIRTETFPEEAWATSEKKAQEILDGWLAGEKTEDSFAALAMEKSQDGSSVNGGLYEDVQQSQMVPEFDAWCFDESRVYGDHDIVKTQFGYHLMFFVDSTPVWEEYVNQNLMAEKANTMMETIVADYPMEVDYSAISLGYVNMAA